MILETICYYLAIWFYELAKYFHDLHNRLAGLPASADAHLEVQLDHSFQDGVKAGYEQAMDDAEEV